MSQPFRDVDTNPFEDPSVQNFTPRVDDGALQGYNPFEKGQSDTTGETQRPVPPLGQSNVLPDVAAQTTVTHNAGGDRLPPNYAPSAAQSATLDLQRRQEELEKKAQELQAREENLANSAASARLKNWPPLPNKCCVGPCFYQDITIEIPDAFQKIVRTMYYMWIFYTFMLFLNMIGALALFIADNDGTTFGVSLLVCVLFTPLSFVCWFRPLYKAFRVDSSFNFMVFFFVFFFQFVVAVFYAVGIPHMGSCGLLNGITTLSTTGSKSVSTYTVGIIAIFIGFLWALFALTSFYMLVKIHRLYRSTGASLAKAQEEFASGVMRNQHVQSAAASVVTNTAQEAINRSVSGIRY